MRPEAVFPLAVLLAAFSRLSLSIYLFPSLSFNSFLLLSLMTSPSISVCLSVDLPIYQPMNLPPLLVEMSEFPRALCI